ncbi:MAG: DUF3592 domain-containing protein [Burkholderiales bacterium]|nr:DUF3592 domain-containing protein [Burkholderiales bacterium]
MQPAQASARPRPGLAQLLLIGMVPLAFLAAGTFLLLHAGPRLIESLAARAWPQADGRVTGAELVEVDEGGGSPGRKGWYDVRIRYAFEADGRTWHGERDGIWRDLRQLAPARERLAAFPEGTAVRVWYHPADPRRSLLDPMVGGGTWTMVAGSVPLMALGLVMSVGFVRGVRRG